MSICFGVAKGPSATSNTLWCRYISLISPIPCNDPYDDSHYVRHSILYPNSTSALGWQISHIVLRASQRWLLTSAGHSRVTPNG